MNVRIKLRILKEIPSIGVEKIEDPATQGCLEHQNPLEVESFNLGVILY